ncbi:MFS transporter [Ferrimicrobium acidiphilum]|uniref:MFS transporter n=1 Tax=Ferrimicrobium acidiphilum TaxID=121039 RepID=UPI0023F54E43|nr:MFS transporter [Ferrimicrobium acidiphilum]
MQQRSRLRSFPHSVFGLYTVAGFYRGAQNMALTTLALIIKEDLGYGAGTIGVISALSGIVLVLVTLFISARLKPAQLERAVSISLIALAIGLLIIGISNSIYLTAFASILLGIGGGLGMPGLAGSVQLAAGKGSANPQRILAIYTLVLSISLAIGPLLEAGLLNATHQDVRWPFIAFAVLPLLALAIMFARRREALALAARMDANGEVEPPHPPATERVRLLRTPEVVKAILAQLMYAVPFAALTVFGAEVARVTDQATAAQAQLAFTVFFVLSLSCRGLVAWRSPIFHKGVIYAISGLLTITGLTFIVVGHSFMLFLVGMVILGIPHGVIFPLVLSALSSSLPADQLPRANSLLMGSSNIVGIIAPFILGVVAAATSYRFMMGTVLIPVVLVFVIFVVIVGLMRTQHRPVTQSAP